MRRRTLITAGCAVGATLLSGCSSEQSPESSEETAQNDTANSEPEEPQADPLPNFSVGAIGFDQTYSKGLISIVELTKEGGDAAETVTITMDVYIDGEIVAEGRKVKDISSEDANKIEVSTEAVGPAGDENIEDVSKVIITGKQVNTDFGDLESVPGETVRSSIGE